MKKVMSATFPRSGHHLLADIIKEYLGSKFRYCGHYNCCYKVPCENQEKVNYYKNHDFYGDVERNMPGWEYVVQYRNPVYAIVSWWKLSLKEGWVPKNSKKADWLQFLNEKTEFWIQFMNKWLIHNPFAHYGINYDDLIRKPVPVAENVMKMMGLQTVNRSRLTEIVYKMNIRRQSELRKFKWFDEKLFRQVDARCDVEMKRLNIKVF